MYGAEAPEDGKFSLGNDGKFSLPELTKLVCKYIAQKLLKMVLKMISLSHTCIKIHTHTLSQCPEDGP
jgi:hypothetical protein